MNPDHDLAETLEELCEFVEKLQSVVVAFSGGVDSTLVAAIAHRTLGASAVAVTAVAETLAEAELDHARKTASQIGIEHRVVVYSELDNPEFTANPTHRCYVCQGMRMDQMLQLARQENYKAVCDGTNASDPHGDRPGLVAVRERGIVSPLLACGIDKQSTRKIARNLGLEAWSRPANACLSSRVPYGQVVTLGKLRRVERAESHLHSLGFHVVRVRHDRDRARVEVGTSEVEQLAKRWSEVEPVLLELGFISASYSEVGYRSGGANMPAVNAP